MMKRMSLKIFKSSYKFIFSSQSKVQLQILQLQITVIMSEQLNMKMTIHPTGRNIDTNQLSNKTCVQITQIQIKSIHSTTMVGFQPTGSEIKYKKCRPAARDTPDLIQTECISDSGLARPTKKIITERKNSKPKINIDKELMGECLTAANKLEKSAKSVRSHLKVKEILQRSSARLKVVREMLEDATQVEHQAVMNHNSNIAEVKCENGSIKTKKCQPAARDTPDLIQTECVPDSGLARHNKIYSITNDVVKQITINKSNIVVVQVSKMFSNSWCISRKCRNKAVHLLYGNRSKKSLSIYHWNMGSRHWTKKQDEIQHIVDEMNPDIVVITEANIFKHDLEHFEHLLNIQRYKLELPKTMDNPRLQCQSSIVD